MKYILTLILSVLLISFNNAQTEFYHQMTETDSVELDLNKADFYASMIRKMDDSLKVDSSNYYAYNLKINILIRTKKYDEAIVTSQLLLSHYPEFMNGYYRLGVLLENKGDKEKAREAFEMAISICKERILNLDRPKSEEIMLAIFYKFIDEEEKAKEIFEKYLSDKHVGKFAKEYLESSKEDLMNPILEKNVK